MKVGGRRVDARVPSWVASDFAAWEREKWSGFGRRSLVCVAERGTALLVEMGSRWGRREKNSWGVRCDDGGGSKEKTRGYLRKNPAKALDPEKMIQVG